MKHLSEWAKGRPPGLVIMAQELAVGAEDSSEFLSLIKVRKKIDAFAVIPKDREWVSLYRNHRKMKRCLMECLRKLGKNGSWLADMGEAYLDGRWLEKGERKFEDRLYALQNTDIEADLTGKVNEEFNKKLRKALGEPEVNFYLRVWVPCYLLYGCCFSDYFDPTFLIRLTGSDYIKGSH